MNTTLHGQAAETSVAEYLKKSGYKLIARNWRSRVCEIDIVAQKDKIIYFVEVKYRSSSAQGDGFEYITAKKQQQMLFAARVWADENGWDGDYRLIGASVSGARYQIVQIVELD